MWLLNASTRKLEYFTSEREVPGGYAILSHTWGKDEVLFDDMVNTTESHKRSDPSLKEGYCKIEHTCSQALKDGLDYTWVDTCCVDKRSSAELSEAINSMFKYYSEAAACYAYLSDVRISDKNKETMDSSERRDEVLQQFSQSRWFTRGWTLQELIAPSRVVFYDCAWHLIASKSGIENLLEEVTKIDRKILRNPILIESTSVAKRMSWASSRSTSRQEDEAYCLMGLFGVNMPLLYGEGVKAFQRLQEEIIRTSAVVDHSILVWEPWKPEHILDRTAVFTVATQLLSPSVYGFRNGHKIESWSLPNIDTFE